jgi:hypothetical protein
MPADANLICFSNATVTGTTTSPSVDIGMGGTPVTSPLVARVFWGSAPATATLTVNVEGSYDNTTWRTVATGQLLVSNLLEGTEAGVRFVTRRRYVRSTITGGSANNVSVQITQAGRSSPELTLD